MEMHLPFFVLRKHTSAEVYQTCAHDHSGRWKDISFLNLPDENSRPSEFYGIHPAQFSLVLSGRDDRNWIGYCFDTRPENDILSGQDLSNDEPAIDPIASSGDPVLADAPIRDARSYFLRVLETRTSEICKEWERVVEEVANRICQYVSQK